MKSILISIKPKYVAKILNGEKTIEIRKTMPKCDLPIDVYIYCTKDTKKYHCFKNNSFNYNKYSAIPIPTNKEWYKSMKHIQLLNGKVVAKFTLNKVEEIRFYDKEVQRKACLTEDELFDYLFVNELYHEDMKNGYAIHISELEIFDKPKELREFKTLKRAKATDCFVCDVYQLTEMCIGNRCLLPKPLTKAPQSFCYVEVPF